MAAVADPAQLLQVPVGLAQALQGVVLLVMAGPSNRKKLPPGIIAENR